MKEHYENLFNACCELPDFEEAAHFVAIKGNLPKSVRFMLVGRACNGWGVDDGRTVSAAAYGEKAVEEFNDTDRWDWINEIQGALYSGDTKEYCVSHSPFWDYSKGIYQMLKNSPCEGVWMKDIIWSNLYKISPGISGNPTEEYKEAEVDACKSILRAEIEDAEPTHILMMTGFDWFEPFSGIFSNVRYLGHNISRGNSKNEIYVEGMAEYKAAKVVIACRPDFRDKESYTNAVVEAFQ